jgi:ribosomal protein L7Ae-like RNA K-turn-binding protein
MSKWLKTLGLAVRARKVVSGQEWVIKEIKLKKVFLVFLATDAAINIEKKILDKCKSYKVPVIQVVTRRELGNAIGKDERVVIGITDPGFAELILVSTDGGEAVWQNCVYMNMPNE